MKKSTLIVAIAASLFTSITLLNCSKKSDPAPAATATTTSGTTTSGTTTAGTTTSGSTTSSTTSGTTTSAKTNNLTLNTWEIVTKSSSTTYTVNQAGITDDAKENTRSYMFGANIGTSSPVSLNFTFAGSGVIPASGIYKMIDFAAGTIPKANEVVVSNGGFGGGFSKLSYNSSILVTNSNSTILIEVTGASLSGYTGSEMTLNAKVEK